MDDDDLKSPGKTIGYQAFEEAAASVRSRTRLQPEEALILGSGLGPLADALEDPDRIPYETIPNWPLSTVLGHSGELVVGRLESRPLIILRGRAHYYEGYAMPQVTFPVRVLQLLGVKTLILTNAAGAVNPAFTPGNLMLLTDHLNLLGMAGPNPLRGPNDERFGPRFPDMSQVYDLKLRALALQVAREEDLTLYQGVYVCLAGPSFETPADLRFLRAIGADAVGMSTVPEAIVARHGGLRVMAVSGISNQANLDGSTVTSHEEVLEAGKQIVPGLSKLVRGVLRQL